MREIENISQKVFLIVFITLLISPMLNADTKSITDTSIYRQHQLQQEGKKLATIGKFDDAIAKFQQALEPQYINRESDKGFAKYSIVKILIWQEKYDKALQEYQWFLNQNKRNNKAIIHAKELQALLQYKMSKDQKGILDYIQLLRSEYKSSLPPFGYDSGIGIGQIVTILRLYDTIGDHVTGIAFIDEILTFLKNRRENRGEAFEVYDRIKTVEDASRCMARGPKGNPDWHGCKFLKEYLLIREAFEQDKREGKKGRATKVIIQSDYFPW